ELPHLIAIRAEPVVEAHEVELLQAELPGQDLRHPVRDHRGGHVEGGHQVEERSRIPALLVEEPLERQRELVAVDQQASGEVGRLEAGEQLIERLRPNGGPRLRLLAREIERAEGELTGENEGALRPAQAWIDQQARTVSTDVDGPPFRQKVDRPERLLLDHIAVLDLEDVAKLLLQYLVRAPPPLAT